MNDACSHIIMIGGSAGSFPAIERILHGLPEQLPACIVIILHRPKNTISEMAHVLSLAGIHEVTEPEDKEYVRNGRIFLVPQNYHMLAEEDGTLSLDYSETELHSRPSINVTFESFGKVYKDSATVLLLSGLNNDGAAGIRFVMKSGGKAYIHHPEECEFTVMPEAAKTDNPKVPYKTMDEIIDIINKTLNSLR